MASPAVAVAQPNGVAALSRPDSPVSVNSSTKRKRDTSEDSAASVNGDQNTKPIINGSYKIIDQKALIRDFCDVVQSLDTENLDILNHPLPEISLHAEPQPKRTKSEDSSKPSSIADKVSCGDYNILDDVVSDIMAVLKMLQARESTVLERGTRSNNRAIAKIAQLRIQILEIYRRELAYPNSEKLRQGQAALSHAGQLGSKGALVLSTFGMIPKLKPVYSSLQRVATQDGIPKSLSDFNLPHGITIAHVQQTAPASADNSGRSLSLGDLFPSPRNLPPLQPPKATKNTTKNNVLTFYHPELTEKSKYRSNTYFSQDVTTGHWLDYSNATPTAYGKTKQRERAQSLAGVKPSSIELEMSEMEALFRGAFSSFAPSKDDSAAIVPSGQVSRMWWQRIGRLNLEKMLDAEVTVDPTEDNEPRKKETIDEEALQTAINNWEEYMIDPTLDQVLGKQSDQDKEVDDLLEEVSDLIETLASYQRNRNLTLPTSQDRYSTDPVNGDLLRNGNASHQPSDEEMATYQALKSQLSLIIKTLPPYAVARLNSDKLEDLNISTKLEIRTDEYKGVMEDDEPARIAKQTAQAAAGNTQRPSHRAPSAPSPAPYATPQYGTPQYGGMNRAMQPNSQHYPQTPVRPQAPSIYAQRPPSGVPVPQPHQAQARPPPPQQYRPASFGGYAAQLAKHQGPHGHSPMPQYPGTPSPSQPRMSPHQPGYANLPQGGTPNQRYPPGYGGNYAQHQHLHTHHQQPQHSQHTQHPQHTQHHPPSAGYSPYANGGQMPRTMSPQVSQAHGYGPSAPIAQHQQHNPRPPYGSPGPGMIPGPGQRHYSTPGGVPPGANPGLTGYHTVMPEVQQRQVMEQARARLGAQQSATGHMGKVAQGEIAGLAGIGLGGPVDINKIAAQRAMQANNGMSVNSRPPMPSPVNGTAHGPPPTPSPVSVHGNTGSPAPGMGFQPPHP